MVNTGSANLSRRAFLLATAATGSLTGPYLTSCGSRVEKPMTRQLGRTGLEVTTLGLGGQASLQWTPEDVDPEQIILKAFSLGVNYFDTSNVYGPSQANYGKAFRTLNLIPGSAGYDEAKRRSIVLASKTMVRQAKALPQEVTGATQGPKGSMAVEDLKRTLSLIFGDGQGNYPEGAYLDLFQIHNLNTLEEVEAIYLGLDNTDPQAEQIGALAALRDYRDGSNLTGLNPNEEKLIRHIGITGHISSPVMIDCMQRDENNVIDTMLIAINANDRMNFNHQYNAIPVGAAKGLGLIAMKVFADGAMYTKEARWSRTPKDVVRVAGTPSLPSRPLVEYALTTPGFATAIIGIGQIDEQEQNCQLVQNLSASQTLPNGLGETDREEVERMAAEVKGGKTNYFQLPAEPLGIPREPEATQERRDKQRVARLTWQTAFAGNKPISHYEILRDQQKINQVEHQPQTTKKHFSFEDALADQATHTYKIVTVDSAGQRAETEELTLAAMG